LDLTYSGMMGIIAAIMDEMCGQVKLSRGRSSRGFEVNVCGIRVTRWTFP